LSKFLPSRLLRPAKYLVEGDGKVKAGFKDIIDAVEYATNLVLSGECRKAVVRATITIEGSE
jgi:hypothetical protein